MNEKISRRGFLKAVGGVSATLALAPISEPVAAFVRPSLQPDDLSANFPQVIPTPDPINLNAISHTHLTLDPLHPKFSSLNEVGMADAKQLVGEWGPYTTEDGRNTPYKSKVFAFLKRYQPNDSNNPNDIEFNILLDNVLRKDVYYCLDTVEIYSDTKNLRTTRADNGKENSTPYGQPTDWHRIFQIWADEERLVYRPVPHSKKVHPVEVCFEKGDYIHPWQMIPNKGCVNYSAVSFYGKSPQNPDFEHWIVGIRLQNPQYNPDNLQQIPIAIDMGFLSNRAKGVFGPNEPYMDGQWSEVLRGLYAPPWTIAGYGNDVRSWPLVIQPQ